MPEEIKIINSTEIDQALKEFESQSIPEEGKTSPIPSGVTFETDNLKSLNILKIDNTPRMVQMLMKYSGGVVKDRKTAEYVLLGFIVVAMSLSLYLFFGGGSKNAKLSPQELQKNELS